MTESRSALTEYSEFLNSLQLTGIAMTNCTCNLDRRKLQTSIEAVKVTVDSEYVPKHIGKMAFQIDAKLLVTGTVAGAKRPLLTINAWYQLDLGSAAKVDAELVKRFARSEARLIAWPYFRELVANICGRMHIPPILLPLNSKA